MTMFPNDAVKTVMESETGTRTRERARERARTEAERGAEEARSRLGNLALDMVEEYFPEEARSRRRRDARRAFFLGVAIGLFVAALLRGRR